MKLNACLSLILMALPMTATMVAAQGSEFAWVNPLPDGAHERLSHGTFQSKAMGREVGFVIYLPLEYEAPENNDRRYPVVYYLHGGRLGSELRGLNMVEYFHRAINSGQIAPRIYVFMNGGKLSHYDYEDSLGETAFVKELIPHIDSTYRTISDRSGRGIEGFSMGGRGTARNMFRYPHLFCSAVPMGGGHQHEKRVSENNGEEQEGVVFEPTNNSWDLASLYAKDRKAHAISILVIVGTEDRNYQPNLDWMDHLTSLGIPFERRIVSGVGHNSNRLYEEQGMTAMQFHENCFASESKGDS